MREICGKYSSYGSQCVRKPGHTEPHKAAHGAVWTEESDARAAAAIAKQMGKGD